MKKAETEIRKKFDVYQKQLSHQKKEIFQQIDEWRNAVFRKIEEHVTNEKCRLDKEFDKQKRSLEKQCQEFMADPAVQEKPKDNEKICLLIERCNELQFELAKVEYHKRPIEFIQVIGKDQLTQKNRNEDNVNEYENRQFSNRSTEENDNGTGNGAGASLRSSQKPTSARDKLPRRQSVETQTSVELDSLTTGNDTSKSDVKSRDDATDKCPICFMIFPKSMGKGDQNQHINEHYGDD